MTIVVTGAAGALGGHAARTVLAAVPPDEVVLVTHRSNIAPELQATGAEVRFGDFDEPRSLGGAFAGGDRLLLVSTPGFDTETRLRQHRNAIDAAQRAGISHVVYTSFLAPHVANPAAVIPVHRATEEYLRGTSLHWTFLRNAPYADGLPKALRHAARTGCWFTNGGLAPSARVAVEDCGAVAGRVLVSGDHQDTALDVTGPAALCDGEVAAAFTAITGIPLEHVPLDDDSYQRFLIGEGLPPEYAAVVSSFGTAMRLRYWAGATTTVADLTGRPATDVATLIRRSRPAADDDWLQLQRLGRNRPPGGKG